jgi:type IV pilus assembly protein PilM
MFKRSRKEASSDAPGDNAGQPEDESNGAPAAVEDAAAAEAAATPAGTPARRSRGSRGGSGRDATFVGLAIEPGLLVAAKSRVNGRVTVERAAFAQIGADVVRDGEVNDVPALAAALSELFKTSKLDKRVRIGIANQRIMMRRIELPPLTNATDIHQAVLFQAQDEIPMPLESVVLDHHSLGIDEGPNGPRLQVLLVAARRDMVERVLQAARLAGLQPEGVDLAAFGMIRALRPADAGADEHILYLAIGGLTNLAISRGSICEFTRVIPWGVEQIAGDVAARCGVPIDDARQLVVEHAAEALAGDGAVEPRQAPAGLAPAEQPFSSPYPIEPDLGAAGPPPAAVSSASDMLSGPPAPSVDAPQVVRTALQDGIRRIASEVRHSLDFYLAGQAGSPVTRALLCGPALEIPGFTDALSRELGITVVRGDVALASPTAAGDVPLSILPVAAALSVPDGPE